jgi:hypothetical protein
VDRVYFNSDFYAGIVLDGITPPIIDLDWGKGAVPVRDSDLRGTFGDIALASTEDFFCFCWGIGAFEEFLFAAIFPTVALGFSTSLLST